MPFLRYGLIGFASFIACRVRDEPSFFSRAVPAIRSSWDESKRYYVPSYHEPGFPAPSGIFRRSRLESREPVVIDSVQSADSMVALTFDACSTFRRPQADTSVIFQLLRSRTPATFFLGGRWMEAFPDLTRLIAETPFFEIGNHSYAHGHMNDVGRERMQWEIRYTQDVAWKLTGVAPRWFRAPYLEAGLDVVNIAADEGLTVVGGNLPSGDPDSMMTARLLVDRLARRVKPGSIIILHANRGGRHTAEALPKIIALLQTKGLHPVTMSTLVEEK